MSSGTMERILRLMAEKRASDVYLSAHAPAQIRINPLLANATVSGMVSITPLQVDLTHHAQLDHWRQRLA